MDNGNGGNPINPEEIYEVRTAETPAEAQELGFIGTVKSFPPELHFTGNEQFRADVFAANTEVPAAVGGAHRDTLDGAVVNSDDAPKTPSGGTTGPGAGQPSTADDK